MRVLIAFALLTTVLSSQEKPAKTPAKTSTTRVAVKDVAQKPECEEPKTILGPDGSIIGWSGIMSSGSGCGPSQKCVAGKLVPDEEANKRDSQERRRKSELFWALRSRVLTLAEMEEVEQHGDSLNIVPCWPYMKSDKDRELNDALLQQFRLRMAAERAKK